MGGGHCQHTLGEGKGNEASKEKRIFPQLKAQKDPSLRLVMTPVEKQLNCGRKTNSIDKIIVIETSCTVNYQPLPV